MVGRESGRAESPEDLGGARNLESLVGGLGFCRAWLSFVS